ncbi:hypothetical protein KIW84_032678 [Lathyrus oleraceus]|uniref:GAG-pre-integrase domain-containing protein n=1 Tax=Pisum sativum TaxID=3888 RepID=A0A9D4XTW4_PEA|nr:hypothetical protein KIW84_UN0792 [Pisum sativum]KAI5427346.1 hypothetical protein KIW84_032678 [Pisum sativum]
MAQMETREASTREVEEEAEDKLTGKAILKGILKDGLYYLSRIGRSPSAYISIRESWHRILGHPNNNTLDKVLKNCNPITDVIPKGDISDEVNSTDSQIEQQSQDDNNATEVDNNVTE